MNPKAEHAKAPPARRALRSELERHLTRAQRNSTAPQRR